MEKIEKLKTELNNEQKKNDAMIHEFQVLRQDIL